MSKHVLRLALVGNPNSGKTALFNRLTGSRQKVANYPGVTVERKEGYFRASSGREFVILDLPGAYSFQPASFDEAITRDFCRGFYPARRRRMCWFVWLMQPICGCICVLYWN